MGLLPHRRSIVRATALVMAFAATGAQVSIAEPVSEQMPSVHSTLSSTRSIAVLRPIDRVRYRQALRLQRAQQFAEADAVLSHVENDLLKSTVLADRYINTRYKASYEELTAWLSAHADAPAAKAIFRLSQGLKPVQEAVEPAVTVVSNGYARSAIYENKHWQAGVAAFKRHDLATAAHYFRNLADSSSITGQDKVAASFWAYRCLKALGSPMHTRYLEQAADSSPSFYSLLAGSLMGESGSLSASAGVKEEVVQALLLEREAVKRAVALAEVGEDALAESELRAVYSASDKSTRQALMALTRQLDLPAVQMQMASSKSVDAFPVPKWEPASGYQVERALLFAIMRQESGFNPNARSASGAVGLMQLMPGTMQDMARGGGAMGKGTDPSVNMTLGQRYLEHLMETPHIGDNLIYLTAAYNAGPGNVASWLHGDYAHSDPLLFIESIPNAQTRDYVQHVMANYWVYSQLLGAEKPSSLHQLAAGNWPRYEGAERQLVALLTRAE